MSILQALFLGILQGVTEFFPISSSAHLVLVESLLKFNVENLFYFNILIHLATLLAVVIYFRKKLFDLIVGFFKRDPVATRTCWAIVIGTIPAVVVGFLLGDYIKAIYSSPLPVLITMIFGGSYFLIAEKIAAHFTKSSPEITLKKGFIIGLVQSIALFHGVSRSGSTTATGLLTGLPRSNAAEFSFLLAIPAIFGAGLYGLLKDDSAGQHFEWAPYSVAFFAALISGFFAISFLMKLYRTRSLKGFGIYLITVGIIGTIFTLTH